MKKEQAIRLLKKKIDSGAATKKDVRNYYLLRKSNASVENKPLQDTSHRMDKHLTRLSGMEGAEKSIKDKIGKNLNGAEHTYSTIDKVFDRINKKREGKNDS